MRINGTELDRVNILDLEKKTVKIPNGINKIGYACFKDLTNLEYLLLPIGIEKIEMCAFENCTWLKKINIPDTVFYIGTNAFAGCIRLEEITLSKLIQLEKRIFQACNPKCKVYYREHTYLVEDILEYY